MRKLVVRLILFYILFPFESQAQYISTSETVPFVCPSICAGGTLILKIFQIDNLSAGAQVQAILSNSTGGFVSGATAISANRYSLSSATGPWINGPYTFSSNAINVFYEFTIPISAAPSSAYLVHFKSGATIGANMQMPCNGFTITPSYSPLAAIASSTIGNNQWVAHAYTWTPTTASALTTPALIAQQSFFAQNNYKGHFLKDSLNFSLNFLNTVGSSKMPGTVGLLNNGTSFQCGDGYTTNYSLRFYRIQNFTPGFYRFSLSADDGARLSIDGGATWLIDMFTEHALATQNTNATFPNGVCMNGPATIVIEYFQRPVDAIVKFNVTPLSNTITQPQNQLLCEGANSAFSVGTSIPSATYQWMVSSDSGISYTPVPVGLPYLGTNTSNLQILNTPFTLNNYLFKCIISGVCGNAFPSDSARITVNPVVAFTAQPLPKVACLGDTVSFSVSSNTTSTYQWLENNGSGFVPINNNGIYANATTAALTINGVAQNFNNNNYKCIISGCGPSVTSDTVSLSFSPLLISVQPQNQELCGSKNLQLFAKADNASAYQWQMSSDKGLTFVNLIDNAIYQNATTSELTILKAESSFNGFVFRCFISGCGQTILSDTCSIFIKASEVDDFVPNVFTPNNDGQNDLFELNTAGLSKISGSIYNRWGQEVYKWTSITDSWDGKYKGALLNDGVYFYSIIATSECDGLELKKNGTISLFK